VNVTLDELQQIVLKEAQKSIHAHAGYKGTLRIYAVAEPLGWPNWTIEAFNPWSPNLEGCRGPLSLAEQLLKDCYQVVGEASDDGRASYEWGRS
jgi:hypothetical protein